MRPSEIKQALQLAFIAKKPAMMWGIPGIGKSSIIQQIALGEMDKKGNYPKARKVFDVRLALLDPTDLRGIPFYDPNANTAKWADSSILPQKGVAEDENAILFLDEINAAPPTIQAAAYQLVLDRRVGEYELPDGVDIVAAGNGEGDKAVVYKMPTPLMNRFLHFDFEMVFDDWYNWAVQNELNADIIGFLKYKNEKLSDFNPKSVSKAFATPRTWHFASDLIKEAAANGIPQDILDKVLKGTVGDGNAIEFIAYRKVSSELPDPMEILRGKIKKMPNLDLSANFSLLISLGQKLKMVHENADGKNQEVGKLTFDEAGGAYLDFIYDQLDAEFCIVGARDCIKNLNIPIIRLDSFKKFANDYGKMIMDA